MSPAESPRRARSAAEWNALFSRVASAVRRLATSASGSHGSDCATLCAFARHLLEREGVACSLVAGSAAWRVGQEDGAVIAHIAGHDVAPDMLGFHVWVSIADTRRIFDPTLYQLPLKAAQLDAMDGGRTEVTWAPDYLVARESWVSSYEAVRRKHAGLFHYEGVPALEARVLRDLALDPTDVAAVELLYRMPDLTAIGPNDRLRGADQA